MPAVSYSDHDALGRADRDSRHWRRVLAILTATLLLAAAGLCSAAPKDGQTFGDWAVRCEKPKNAPKETCFIFQNHVTKKDHKPVLRIAVGYLPTKNQPVAVITMPLGIALPPGVQIKVDNNEAVRVPVERCEPQGCRAGVILGDKLLAQLKAGQKAEITFDDGARHPITVPVSLKGFTAGLSSLH